MDRNDKENYSGFTDAYDKASKQDVKIQKLNC